MKYTVSVEREYGKQKEYMLDVNKLDRNQSELDAVEQEKAAITLENRDQRLEYDQELSEKIQIAVESSRLEYEHSFRRAERLDNKVYILLTVCGFIFVLLTTAINRVSEIDVFAIWNALIALYDVSLILSIAGTVALLLILISSLSGKKFKRYDSFAILEKNLISSMDRRTFSIYTIMKYEKARDFNNDIVSKQYKKVNHAVYLLIFVVIMLMIVTILGNFVPTRDNIDQTTEAVMLDNAMDTVGITQLESEEKSVQTK